MKRIAVTLSLVATLGIASLAQAQATRTWVSGVGDDANPCSRTAPCKTFAGAISKTAAGGEIDVLDPGGFGAVTITKSLKIDGGPFTGGILAAGVNGILVNAAATDVIMIRNISFNGNNTVGAFNGIRVLSAKALHVDGCEFYDWGGRGISIETPNSINVSVRRSVIRNNTSHGILALPNGAGSVQLNVEDTGIIGNGGNAIDLAGNGDAVVTRSNLSLNTGAGIILEAASSRAKLESTTIASNGFGIFSGNGTAPTCFISRCIITRNNDGLHFGGGSIIGFNNNTIVDNGGSNTVTSSSAQQ